MSEPIRTKPKSSMKIDNAPTPHNTPASVLNNSFLKNGNPVGHQPGGRTSNREGTIPQTISEEDIQSALANQPLLLQSIQDKLGSLVGQDSGYVSQLPKSVRERIYGLKKLQNDLFSIEKDFQIDMFELEQKYLTKYGPLHERRCRIVKGEENPTPEEVAKGRELELEEEGDEDEGEEEKEADESGEDDIKGIPSFWLTALENLPVVSETITDRDAEILDFLIDVRVEYLTNGKPGFKLLFEFDPETPYLKEKLLVKTYHYQSELGYSGDFIYDHADGQKITWSDKESNPTISVEMRKQRNKVTKQVRTIEKVTPVDSFFNFFDPPTVPSTKDNAATDNGEGESEDQDGQDEEELADLEARLALDYSIGEQIKDKLVPRAIDWFTGAALEYEFDNEAAETELEDDYQDGEDDDEDDDDDDDDEDQDGNEEPDDFAAAKEQPPDCKQS
ncbi:hypothetical protein HG535_0H00670 [Zygotorulaspora mrakii]|uniref:Nucleosome assembly protein n=1 Tax=Zygotorulaspora mrakii TaxID=42260 RepID=A0A7H9BAJ3_ZYGMR|nr:uncharacterized protein HG535_0H00670 [Zygotorulaspora mrakii]QLG74742.1 hypothetical protein HG535_0H00670 [Zygotorulaspora mrakii]